MSADAATPTEKHIDGDEHDDGDQGGDADVQINVESPLQMSADAATPTEKHIDGDEHDDGDQGGDADVQINVESPLQMSANIEVFNVAGDGGHGDFDADENDLKVVVILKSSPEEVVSIKAKEFEEFGRQYGGVEENDVHSETVFVNEPRIEEIIEEDMPRNDDVLRRYAKSVLKRLFQLKLKSLKSLEGNMEEIAMPDSSHSGSESSSEQHIDGDEHDDGDQGDGGHGDFDADENDLKVAAILKSSPEE
nr:hypothetical protein [Tanacetum cinerariifolium]